MKEIKQVHVVKSRSLTEQVVATFAVEDSQRHAGRFKVIKIRPKQGDQLIEKDNLDEGQAEEACDRLACEERDMRASIAEGSFYLVATFTAGYRYTVGLKL